jgi:hypothetical protein
MTIQSGPEAVVPTVEVGLLRILVLDDDGDVLEGRDELRRQAVERGSHVLVEVHQ